jgi:pimeloyl-ACP methyl ester carboxylesterase
MIQLVTIPHAGHLVHCQQPAAFTAAVLDFLSPL